jgi:hypothetical protein
MLVAAGAVATVYVGTWMAPTTSPVMSPVKPLVDTTGPEKVDEPMEISCRGKCQPHHAAVRDNARIHHNVIKRKRGHTGRCTAPLTA